MNRAGELVGLIFDGNIQSLVLDFVYSDKEARATSVHSSSIIEALRKVYDAGLLADELTAGNAGIIREAGRDRRRWPVTHFRPVDGFAIRIADFSEYKPEYRDDVKVIEYVILDENERPEYELAWSEFAHWGAQARDPARAARRVRREPP